MKQMIMTHTLAQLEEILRCLMANTHQEGLDTRIELIRYYKGVIENMKKVNA